VIENVCYSKPDNQTLTHAETNSRTHKQVATYPPRRVDFAVEMTVRAFEPTLVMADFPIAVALLTAALLTTAVLVFLAISVAEAATDPPACPTFRVAIFQV
jgi:hypothetical protein